MAVINKYKLLAGKDLRENIEINLEGDEVVIRPLTNKEWAHVNATRSRGFKVNDKGEVVGDGGVATKNMADAQNLVVNYGLVEPRLSLKEVEDLAPNLVEYIADKILKLSGLKPNESVTEGLPSAEDTEEVHEEVKSFRNE